MPSTSVDITVILACRDRGRFLHPAVRSVADAVERAESELGISIEWLTVAAPSSEATEQYLSNHLPSRSRRVRFAGTDLAAAKNQAVAEARGRYIAMTGGDDLVSSNWLSKSYELCMAEPRAVVFHPHAVIVFGDTRLLYVTPDQEDPDLSPDAIFARNLWPATSVGQAKIYRDHKFVDADQERGFGYSDWHWVCETVASGVVHRPVPRTLSCCRQQDTHTCVPVPGRLTDLLPRSRFFQRSPAGARVT
ncbi:MAG TPA: glycosyltransferase family 2 protein [Candidatus Obscuribacterales bacterium]